MEEPGVANMFKGTLPQIVAAITGTVSAISDGMHYGWSAPVIPILQSKDSPIVISKNDESWLETIYLIGGLAGLPVTIYLVDKVGRKNLTIFASCSSLISWILIAVARSTVLLYVARFLSGLAGDVAFVATPMYIAEIADQKIRGFLSSIIYLMMLFGILFIYLVAPFTPFYAPSVVGGLLLSAQLVCFSFMPKSPYYLLTKNKVDAARAALNKLRSTKNNELELEEISRAVERQKKEKGRPVDLLMVTSNRRGLSIVAVLNAAQHFCGISVMMMNMHSILVEADSVYFKSTTAAIMFASVMLVAATLTSFSVDKYGRKVLLVTSSALTGVCLLVLAIYFHLKNSQHDMKSVSWIPVACVMTYAAVFKMGLGMVPIVVSAELFPNKVKAMGMTAGDGMYLIFGLLSIEFYKRTSESYGIHIPFYVFALLGFVTTVFCAYIVPETKGKSLEEIQFLLKGQPVISKREESGYDC